VPAFDGLFKKFGDGQRVDIDFVDRALLSKVEHFVGRVGQVTGEGGEATGQLVAWDNADLASCVHGVATDEELLRLAVNQTTGMRAADTLRPNLQREVGRDGEELVVALAEIVRRVSKAPQLSRPRHDGAESAFHGGPVAFGIGVKNGEVRVDAGDVEGFRAKRGRGREREVE
jgi:hypothetical protein